jgi:hypothetical protein
MVRMVVWGYGEDGGVGVVCACVWETPHKPGVWGLWGGGEGDDVCSCREQLRVVDW